MSCLAECLLGVATKDGSGAQEQSSMEGYLVNDIEQEALLYQMQYS